MSTERSRNDTAPTKSPLCMISKEELAHHGYVHIAITHMHTRTYVNICAHKLTYERVALRKMQEPPCAQRHRYRDAQIQTHSTDAHQNAHRHTDTKAPWKVSRGECMAPLLTAFTLVRASGRAAAEGFRRTSTHEKNRRTDARNTYRRTVPPKLFTIV